MGAHTAHTKSNSRAVRSVDAQCALCVNYAHADTASGGMVCTPDLRVRTVTTVETSLGVLRAAVTQEIATRCTHARILLSAPASHPLYVYTVRATRVRGAAYIYKQFNGVQHHHALTHGGECRSSR